MTTPTIVFTVGLLSTYVVTSAVTYVQLLPPYRRLTLVSVPNAKHIKPAVVWGYIHAYVHRDQPL